MTEPGSFRYRPARRRPPAEAWTAERVAELRASLGLSQAGFGEELGVRQQTVSEWETGRYQPRGASARMLGILAESSERYDAGGGP
ncbi:MAG: helix-turn-helix domain-containing protein [Dehalococcoidia bacterium]